MVLHTGFLMRHVVSNSAAGEKNAQELFHWLNANRVVNSTDGIQEQKQNKSDSNQDTSFKFLQSLYTLAKNLYNFY